MSTPKHSVSVAGVVVDSLERVLLIKRRDNGKWEPPGGVLELEESIENGLVREVREETGVSVQVGRLTGVYKNMPSGIVALVFRCSPTTFPAVSTEEAASVRWVDRDRAAVIMDPVYAIRVSDALLEGPPKIRTHDGVKIIGN